MGIIGGADGPTAIFLAALQGGEWLLIGLLLALSAGFWLYRRRKK